MRPLTDLRTAAAALRATLSDASPRGSAVLAAARDVGHAARRARYGSAQLAPFLGRTLLPVLRTHHPGPGGDWLWERVVATVRAAHAEAATEAPADAAVAVASAAVAAAGLARLGTRAAAHATAPPVVYRVDADDVITRVNAAWGAFAAANGAPALATEAVGTSLWAHVGGEEARQLYGAVHAAVRASGRAVVLPFRCDAPDERRWMELAVRPVGRGHLQVASTLVRRAARAPVALLDPAAPRGTTRLRMCSWCKRVRPDGDHRPAGSPSGPHLWVDPETLPLAPPAAGAGAAALPRLAHDVCPDCAAGVRAALASA